MNEYDSNRIYDLVKKKLITERLVILKCGLLYFQHLAILEKKLLKKSIMT